MTDTVKPLLILFSVSDSWGCGPNITFINDGEEEDEGDDRFYESFEINSRKDDKYAVHFIYNSHKGIGEKFLGGHDTLAVAQSIMLQAYSHVNGCGPFIETGSTFKSDNGHYGPAVPVTDEAVLDIDLESGFSKPTFAVIMFQERVVDSLCIEPRA